jgi:hypothetical protein
MKFKNILFFLNVFSNDDLKIKLLDKCSKKSLSFFLHNQIINDLSSIKKFNHDDLYKSFLKDYFSVYIKIRDGQILYETKIKRFRWLNDRLNILLKHLNQINNIFKLPNTDLVIHLGDGFFNKKINLDSLDGPIFVPSKSIFFNKNLILFPDVQCLEGEHIINQIELFNSSINWCSKINKTIWRGNFSGGYKDPFLNPRYIAVNLSKSIPDVLDAKLIFSLYNNQYRQKHHPFYNFIKQLILDGCFSPSLDLNSQLLYKYQLLIDGNTSSWMGSLWRLFSKSCTFKVESEYIQWYSNGLIPNKHYVPIKKDLSDFHEKMNYFIQNDSLSEKIANNAHEFATNNLRIEDIYYYIYCLLQEYSKLQNF